MSLYKNLTTPLSQEAKDVIKAVLIVVTLLIVVLWGTFEIMQKAEAARDERRKATANPTTPSYILSLRLKQVEVFNLLDGTQCAQSTTSITCNWKEKPAP